MGSLRETLTSPCRIVLCWSAYLSLVSQSLVTGASEFPPPAPGDDLIGKNFEITLLYEDTLAALAQEFDAGYQELKDANPGVDAWLPGAGTKLKLPFQYILPEAERRGVIINLAEYRLYYFLPEPTPTDSSGNPAGPSSGDVRAFSRIYTFPIGLGREGFATPVMQTRIVTRIENPSWTPTASIRKEHQDQGDILPAVVPAGPENPLGKLAIQLAAPGYFIHGTNKPFGVGQRVSHGCIRLYNEDIERLVALAPNDTQVKIIDQPVKLGWLQGQLYLEVHRPLGEPTEADGQRSQLVRRIVAEIAASRWPERRVDWARVDQVIEGKRGIPERITLDP